MPVLKRDDNIINLGGSFNAHLGHALVFWPCSRINHPAQVKRGYRILVKNP
ncbi:MAG TPA: hypothetical protein VI756_09415 [Blastocatellia bacterium]